MIFWLTLDPLLGPTAFEKRRKCKPRAHNQKAQPFASNEWGMAKVMNGMKSIKGTKSMKGMAEPFCLRASTMAQQVAQSDAPHEGLSSSRSPDRRRAA